MSRSDAACLVGAGCIPLQRRSWAVHRGTRERSNEDTVAAAWPVIKTQHRANASLATRDADVPLIGRGDARSEDLACPPPLHCRRLVNDVGNRTESFHTVRILNGIRESCQAICLVFCWIGERRAADWRRPAGGVGQERPRVWGVAENRRSSAPIRPCVKERFDIAAIGGAVRVDISVRRA